MTLTFGSLFAGVGGFDRGLEQAGMRCLWQVEIDAKCRQVLARHWPDVQRWEDVRDVGRHNLESVDVVCGGFPCVDISIAGNGAGIAGKDSGLWAEFARIIRELRPRFVLVENVAALLFRGMGRVLGDLAAIGYDAEWQVLPAGAFGAPHVRERVYIVAYPRGKHGSPRLAFQREHARAILAESDRNRTRFWEAAPTEYSGMADGVPNRVDRIRMMGNAVVPQIAHWLGRRILEAL